MFFHYFFFSQVLQLVIIFLDFLDGWTNSWKQLENLCNENNNLKEQLAQLQNSDALNDGVDTSSTTPVIHCELDAQIQELAQLKEYLEKTSSNKIRIAKQIKEDTLQKYSDQPL